VAAPVKTLLDHAVVKLGGGCDEAKEAYVKHCMESPVECRDKGATDGVMDAYGAVLNGGAYLDACKSPPSAGVKVCAAVKDGRAVGVTVVLSPGEEAVAACIAQKVHELAFPAYPRLDVTNTSFAAQ
jgi:hypothetical protein